MMDISSTGVVLVLAALAVVVLALAAMLFSRKPKRPEKWEKAEIMKQLLALSEHEESLQRPAPAAVRMRTPARTATRPATSALKATTKAALPARSKAR